MKIQEDQIMTRFVTKPLESKLGDFEAESSQKSHKNKFQIKVCDINGHDISSNTKSTDIHLSNSKDSSKFDQVSPPDNFLELDGNTPGKAELVRKMHQHDLFSPDLNQDSDTYLSDSEVDLIKSSFDQSDEFIWQQQGIQRHMHPEGFK